MTPEDSLKLDHILIILEHYYQWNCEKWRADHSIINEHFSVINRHIDEFTQRLLVRLPDSLKTSIPIVECPDKEIVLIFVLIRMISCIKE